MSVFYLFDVSPPESLLIGHYSFGRIPVKLPLIRLGSERSI